MRLLILERKPRSPLIRSRLPTNPPITASKQDTPHGHCRKEATPHRIHPKAQDARLRPHGVRVKGVCRVEEGCYCEGWERVGRFGVFGVRGRAAGFGEAGCERDGAG